MRALRTVFLVALALAISAPQMVAAQSTGSIRGYVRFLDADGEPPLADALVTATSSSGVWKTRTDQHGFFVLWGIQPGIVTIVAEENGYAGHLPAVRSFCMHAGEDDSVTLYLDRRLSDPAPGLEYRLSLQRMRPNPSQTADLYSIGEC